MFTGDGDAAIRVGWQASDSTWRVPQLDVMIGAIGPGDEWVQMAGLVRVPEGVGFMVPLPNGTGQCSEDDAIWYDDVVVFRID